MDLQYVTPQTLVVGAGQVVSKHAARSAAVASHVAGSDAMKSSHVPLWVKMRHEPAEEHGTVKVAG